MLNVEGLGLSNGCLSVGIYNRNYLNKARRVAGIWATGRFLGPQLNIILKADTNGIHSLSRFLWQASPPHANDKAQSGVDLPR
jgi:hypothetical protein